jgi:2-polyprenyl-3-methyl-5-hydroxy-6-metoxy-1,4-benzoquinol methylase
VETFKKKDYCDMSLVDQQSCIACGSGMQVFIERIVDDRYGCPGVYSIQQCAACGQMATTPPLKEEDLPGLYSQYYPRRHVDFDALEAEAARAIAPRAPLRRWLAGTDNQGHYLARPGQKVLDIGSGSCLSLLELRQMGVDAWGVEADPNVRAIAERYQLKVHIGSIHDTPFPGETFDLIVLNQVIEHVPSPEALLHTIKGRLNPGGRVVLSFPNAGSWQRKLSGSRWINWHVPYHQHHFNRHSFGMLAQRTGYEVGRVRTITPNLWTILQMRAMAEKPIEGQASTSWSHGRSQSQRIGFADRVRNALAARLARAAGAGLAIVNRCVDVLGQGDSLLVELRVKSIRR